MKSFSSLCALTLVLSGVASVASVACAGEVSLEERPCPCTAGWTCCAARNVCVADGTSCERTSGDGTTSSSGSTNGSSDASAPGPIELAVGQSARCMTTDRDHVYWANADGLVVGNVKTGGNLQASSFRTPVANNPLCGIAVDGETLFTTAYEYGKIVQLSLSSSSSWSIGAVSGLFGTLTTPSSLSLDTDNAYVTEYEAGRVTQVPRSRAAQTVLAEGLTRPHGVEIVGADVIFAERGAPDTKTGAIKRVPKNGGEVVVLAEAQDDVFALTVWNGVVYWVSKDGVYETSILGGGPQRLARGTSPSGPIAVDGAYIYFVDLGRVSKSRINGGEPIDWDPSRLTVSFTIDEAQMFWADGARILTHYK